MISSPKQLQLALFSFFLQLFQFSSLHSFHYLNSNTIRNMMRPQFSRSLGLLRRIPNRSFVPAVSLSQRAYSSASRVPDFAFAFEYVSLITNDSCLDSHDLMNTVSMAFSCDPPKPSPALQTPSSSSNPKASLSFSSPTAVESMRRKRWRN